jgi:hypothetical protein
MANVASSLGDLLADFRGGIVDHKHVLFAGDSRQLVEIRQQCCDLFRPQVCERRHLLAVML